MPAGREIPRFRDRIGPVRRGSRSPRLDGAGWLGAGGEVEKFSAGLAVVGTEGVGLVASYSRC